MFIKTEISRLRLEMHHVILILSYYRREQLKILQLTLAKDSDTSDDSSASELEDDDLEMLLLSTLWPSHKDKGVHINYLDIPDQDFENMFR